MAESSSLWMSLSLPSRGRERLRYRAFTLVEMSVVIVVIGLIMMTVFPALTALRTSTQRSLTQSNLQTLMQATAAYVQAHGCLPCPTPASTTSSSFGHVRGDTLAASCDSLPSNTCTQPEGIPPFTSLGLPASTAHDGWGHWITMRVDSALTANFNVVPPARPVTCTCTLSGSTCTASPTGCTCPAPVGGVCLPSFSASSQGLCATGLASTNRLNIQTIGGASQQAAVIFVSHGAGGFGSLIAQAMPNGFNGSCLSFPSSYPSCPSSSASPTTGFAACNSFCNTANKTRFVDSPLLVGGGNPYDDILAYADRNTLVSTFGNGSCQTAW